MSKTTPYTPEQISNHIHNTIHSPSPKKTTKEACAFLRISRTTFWKIVKNGQISFIQIGRRKLYDLNELEKLCACFTFQNTPAPADNAEVTK